MQIIALYNYFFKRFIQRIYQGTSVLYPVADSAVRDVDAFSFKTLHLAVERKMIHIFINDNLRQQTGANNGFRQRAINHGRNDDALIIGLYIFRTYITVYK